MATIQPTLTGVPDTAAGAGFVASWGPIHQGDVCTPITELSGKVDHADRSVQVEGTFGGATIALNGSNDKSNFRTLNDPSMTPLTFTAAGLRAVLEAVVQFAPSISGGDGTTGVTVSVLLRRLR
jgi:hypothetical protein